MSFFFFLNNLNTWFSLTIFTIRLFQFCINTNLHVRDSNDGFSKRFSMSKLKQNLLNTHTLGIMWKVCIMNKVESPAFSRHFVTTLI